MTSSERARKSSVERRGNRRFGFDGAATSGGGIRRRDAIIGGVAIAAVAIVFAVFALIAITAESEKPELVAGTFFVPYYDGDSTNGAVAFSAIDGGPAGRLAQVPTLVGQERNNQQWVEVYNTPSGGFLVDRATGNTSLVLPALNTASKNPTTLAAPAAGTAALAGSSLMGFTAGDNLFIVRRAQQPGGDYFGDVHLLTAGSVAGGVEVGASELDGVLSASTLLVDEAVVAGDERFSGLGESGRYTHSFAVAAAGDSLYLVLGDGSGSARLVRVSPPGPEAIAEFESALENGAEDVAPPRLTVTELGTVGEATVLTPLSSGNGVAAADPSSGEVSAWGPDGSLGSASVEALRGATEVLPVEGGSLAWFAIRGDDGWSIAGAGTSGQVRTIPLPASGSVDIAPPVMVGMNIFTASRQDGRIIAVDTEAGSALSVWSDGVYPTDPELDGAGSSGGGLASLDFGGVTLERFGSRVVVNVPAASLAVLLNSDGTLVQVLEKGRAKPIDPNAVLDPERRGDAEPPPPEEEPEETVGTEAGSFEREGDTSLACDPTVQTEPRAPLLLPQSGPRAATAISPRWRYELVSASDCLPSFRVQIRKLPNGDEELRDLPRPNSLNATITELEPSTDYEVVILAFIGELEARSNAALYRTGEAAPDLPTNVRFIDDGSRWEIEWDACTSSSDCAEPADSFEVEWSDGSGFGSGSAQVSGVGAKRQAVAITDENVGRNLCFTVTAVGEGDTASAPAPSAAGLCGARERAPSGTGSVFSVSARPVAGSASQEVVFTLNGVTRQNFPLIMGTRGQIFVDVSLPNVPGYEGVTSFAWNYSDIPSTGFLDDPVPFPGVPATLSSYDYRVTFRNSAGSETSEGSRPLDPISCGVLNVNISGFNVFDAGSRSWPIRFTPENPCPGGVPTPALVVAAPPGCPAYPANLSIQCTTSNTNVDSGSRTAFGYTVQLPSIPGFQFDGLNFTGGPFDLIKPNTDAFNGKVFVHAATRDGIEATTYTVLLKSVNLVTPPTMPLCTFLGRNGNVTSFRCAAPEDNQPNIPREFTYQPGLALPQGPFPANAGQCGGLASPMGDIIPSGALTIPGGPTACRIGLKKLQGPVPTTSEPPDPFCPYLPDDPRFPDDPRCVDPTTTTTTTVPASMVPLGLFLVAGIASRSALAGWRRRTRNRTSL